MITVTLFTAYQEIVDVVWREREGSDGDRFLLLRRLELQSLLRRAQHIQRPRAHPSIRRDGDKVVRVLRPHHTQAVHGMLRKNKRYSCVSSSIYLHIFHYWTISVERSFLRHLRNYCHSIKPGTVQSSETKFICSFTNITLHLTVFCLLKKLNFP